MAEAPTEKEETDLLALVKYDEACRAVAEARSVDEAREWRNKAEGMRAYARQANNRQLEIDAAEIRMRAERRLGELMRAQKDTVGLNRGAKGNPGGRGAAIVRDENRPAQPTLAAAGIDKHLADRARKMAAMSERRFEKELGNWRESAEAQGGLITPNILSSKQPEHLNQQKHAIHYSSETPEHYTPKAILDAVIACLGTIDLDPCSNEGKPNVQARNHYTVADNGLIKPWIGKVFMNPPYGRGVIDPWPPKLLSEYALKNVTEAIALIPARTDTHWFQRFRGCPILFVNGRLQFIGNEANAPFPSALVYVGKRIDSFARNFRGFGDVWVLYES